MVAQTNQESIETHAQVDFTKQNEQVRSVVREHILAHPEEDPPGINGSDIAQIMEERFNVGPDFCAHARLGDCCQRGWLKKTQFKRPAKKSGRSGALFVDVPDTTLDVAQAQFDYWSEAHARHVEERERADTNIERDVQMVAKYRAALERAKQPQDGVVV